MIQLDRIHGLIARTRGRMRRQAALEWGTTAFILALAGSLVVLWFWRMEYLSDAAGIDCVAGLGGAVVIAAVVGASRRFPTHMVAARLDRASGLSDRLGTAVEFAERLGKGDALKTEHAETVALMEAAVTDAVRAVERANPKLAAPYKAPRDWRGAALFAGLTAAVATLAFHPDHTGGQGIAVTGKGIDGIGQADLDKNMMDPDDAKYVREQYVDDLKKMAEQTGDPYLKKLAEQLEDLLDKAEKGEISKEELLAKMDELEKNYMDGSDQDEQKMLDDLKDTGKQLQQEPLTKRLGDALEAGDMNAAQKEMDRLAEQLQNKELTPQQEKKVQEALDKAEKKHDEAAKKEQDKKDAEIQKQIEKKKDEKKRLEKQAQQDPKNEDTKKRLDKNKRELEKLERDKQNQKQEQEKHALQRLHRDMKNAAENMKKEQQPNQNKQDREQARKDAAQNMKEGAQDSQKTGEEIQKIKNQKSAQSQLGDLKDAIRRAKQKNGNGTQQGQGQAHARLQKIKEWEDRAGGGQGNRGAWKPGQGQGQGQGQGKDGQGQGQKGPGHGGGKGGDGYGDEHDANLMGDPTKLSGHKNDEKLHGLQGRGPSMRETILTSAKKGFATESYKSVYAQYQKIVEEVMNQEKVPQGYKYYVNRYFNRIKPHNI